MAELILILTMLAFCWEATDGEPLWRVKASGGTTTTITLDVTDTTSPFYNVNWATVADDFLAGFMVQFAPDTTTVALRRQWYFIDSHSKSGDTVTITVTATMAAAAASGDKVYIFFPLPAENIQTTLLTDPIPRNFQTLSMDKAPDLAGLQSNSITAAIELPALGTKLGSSYVADRISKLLEVIGAVSSETGTDTESGSSGTTLNVTDASGIAVGSYLRIKIGGKGYVRKVTARDTVSTPNTFTMDRALPSDPADGVAVRAAETITPAETGQKAVTFLHLKDSQLEELFGVRFSATVTGNLNEGTMLNITGQGTTWDISTGFSCVDPHDDVSKIPVVGAELRGGSTDYDAREMTLDFGIAVSRQMFGRTQKQIVTDRNSSTTVKVLNDGISPKTLEQNKTLTDCQLHADDDGDGAILLVTSGTVTAVNSDAEGARYWDLTIKHGDDQTDPNNPVKAQLLRF